MEPQNIESQLMKLDVNSRAKLAKKLLLSLDELSEMEIEKLWAEEALKRDNEINEGKATPKPASKVFKKARAQLK